MLQQLPDGLGQERRHAVLAAPRHDVDPAALRGDVAAVADLQGAKIKAAKSIRDGGGDRGLDVAAKFDDTTKHHIAQCARSQRDTDGRGHFWERTCPP